MPGKAKAQGMPKLLAAHVHDLLVHTGFAKTAKKFESEYDDEVRFCFCSQHTASACSPLHAKFVRIPRPTIVRRFVVEFSF